MKKRITKSNIIKKSDEVIVKRNFIEQTLLNLKHLIQNNQVIVVRSIIAFVLVALIGIILFGLNHWFVIKSYEKLYSARKDIKKAGEAFKYISLLSFEKSKPAKKNRDKKKAKESDFLVKSKQEAEKNFKSGKKSLIELSSSMVYIFSPASALALYELGLAYLKKKEYSQATGYFFKFYSENPKHFLSPNALDMEGLSFEFLEKDRDALNRYTRLFNEYSSSYLAPKALYSMARMSEKIKDFKKAKKSYKKLIRIYKDTSLFYVKLAKKRLYLIGLENI